MCEQKSLKFLREKLNASKNIFENFFQRKIRSLTSSKVHKSGIFKTTKSTRKPIQKGIATLSVYWKNIKVASNTQRILCTMTGNSLNPCSNRLFSPRTKTAHINLGFFHGLGCHGFWVLGCHNTVKKAPKKTEKILFLLHFI